MIGDWGIGWILDLDIVVIGCSAGMRWGSFLFCFLNVKIVRHKRLSMGLLVGIDF